MARQILDSAGNVIDGILVGAFDKLNVIQIQNRLLNGTYIVQTLGNQSTEVEVEFYCLKTQKRILDADAANGAIITVTYDEDTWQGYVADGMIDSDPTPPKHYKLNFTLLVTED